MMARGYAGRHVVGRESWVTGWKPVLREEAFDDLAVDVGEAVVAAGMAERQPFVVEPEQVEDRRVEVVDVDSV